jgi:tetratricopeptide (TPR) repeat protein
LLAERAWQAWLRHPDDPELGQTLGLLRARAALAAGDYAVAEELLATAGDADANHRLDWALVRGRLLSHRGEYSAAATLLQDLLHAYSELDASDERAGELRRLAVQAQRFLGHDELALQLIDQTIEWQRRSLPAAHPRLVLSSLYRVGPLAAVSGTDAALAEAERLLPIVEHSFGADSTVTAATLSAIASTLNQADRLTEAAAAYERALASWRRAAGERHQNSLRTAFNLAQLRAAIDPADPRIDELYAEVVGQGELALGAERHAVLFWRLGWVEYLLGRGELERAHGLIDERAGLLLSPDRRDFIDRYFKHADAAVAQHCASAPPSARCSQFQTRLAALRAASNLPAAVTAAAGPTVDPSKAPTTTQGATQ